MTVFSVSPSLKKMIGRTDEPSIFDMSVSTDYLDNFYQRDVDHYLAHYLARAS
jgi:hypothetical protein